MNKMTISAKALFKISLAIGFGVGFLTPLFDLLAQFVVHTILLAAYYLFY